MWINRRRAFTIIELMVVVLVMGILATLAVAHFQSVTQRAYRAKALDVAKQAGEILNLYWQVTGGNFSNSFTGQGCSPPCDYTITIEGQGYAFRRSLYRGSTAGEYYYVVYAGNSNTLAVHRSSNNAKILDFEYQHSQATYTTNPP